MPKKPGDPRECYDAIGPEKICQIFLDMSKEGCQPVEIAAELGICKRTLQKWSTDDRKPEFQHAYQLGKTFGEAYHTKTLREGAAGKIKGWKPTGNIYILKSCYGGHWRKDGHHHVIDVNARKKLDPTDANMIKSLERRVQANIFDSISAATEAEYSDE